MIADRVLVAGHICLDLISEVRSPSAESMLESIRPGRTLFMGPLKMIPGGAVGNVGIALARLGVPVVLSARVGNDELADTLKSLLRTLAPAATTTTSFQTSARRACI